APDPVQCLKSLSSSRILTALRQGPYGADTLNQKLLTYFQQKTAPHEWLALPILVTQNDPTRALYNGTTGVLIKDTAYFEGADGLRSFPETVLPYYEVAFCLSVHKSQGSEFDEVFALFPPGSEIFGKEALYTAVTRARKKVTLVSDEETVKALLATSSRTRSGFKERFLSKLEHLTLD
ncbi:MAG TPA: ATP-binding domain-containing protein, partial [Chlamydiales bacterium]